jgi:predicted DCC family thiol-disulfide oxidoreductase YuxK
MTEIITPHAIYVVYDGECPFCRNYVRLANLRAAGTAVELVDAREMDPIALECAKRGFDLDEGMVVILEGRFYHGGDAVNRIALISSSSGIINTVNRWIFRHPGLSRLLYPGLRACRNFTLRVLGVSPIGLKVHRRDAAKRN